MATPSLNFRNRAEKEANSLRSDSLLLFSARLRKFKAPSRAGTTRPSVGGAWRCLLFLFLVLPSSARGASTASSSRAPRSEGRAPPPSSRAPPSEGRASGSNSRIPRSEGRACASETRIPPSEGQVSLSNTRIRVSEGRVRLSEIRRPRFERRVPPSDRRIPSSEVRIRLSNSRQLHSLRPTFRPRTLDVVGLTLTNDFQTVEVVGLRSRVSP